MTSEQSNGADVIKHQVYLQRRMEAAKAEDFLLLTWAAFITCLAWASGVGHGVTNALGLVPPPENVDLVFVEGLGATIVGGATMLLIKPATAILRRLMVAHPDPSATAKQTEEGSSEAAISRLSTTMGVLAVASVLIGIPSTTYIIQMIVTSEIVQMAAILSGYLFWVLAIGCFVQARRTLKRHIR